eukprot:13546449-Alexandrium_andersonii.AAC.1
MAVIDLLQGRHATEEIWHVKPEDKASYLDTMGRRWMNLCRAVSQGQIKATQWALCLPWVVRSSGVDVMKRPAAAKQLPKQPPKQPEPVVYDGDEAGEEEEQEEDEEEDDGDSTATQAHMGVGEQD